MMTGIDRFREWFRGCENQYAIIGGTACELLMREEGLDFRATKDIDLVLIVEALTPEFGRKFWQFIQTAGYEHRNKSTGSPQFYRFSHPAVEGYPVMLELFSRQPDTIQLPEDALLTPLPVEEDISSLSAILLDAAYYQLVCSGTVVVDGINVLNAEYLIPFKAKAWLDLTQRKAAGQAIDSKNIRKHKNDVFRLSALLTQQTSVAISEEVRADLRAFFTAMQTETVDTVQMGIMRDQEMILSGLMKIYGI